MGAYYERRILLMIKYIKKKKLIKQKQRWMPIMKEDFCQ